MNVSACLVTRGDVDMQPIIDSLPPSWEVVIWDNGERRVSRSDGWAEVCSDVSVYGRYSAIQHATHELIYVQDDDVIVSDPQAIVDEWVRQVPILGEEIMQRMGIREAMGDDTLTGEYENHVVCNMPPEFRHDFYEDHALVGFGAAFHRDAPRRAFDRFEQWRGDGGSMMVTTPDFWNRTCDVVFTALTPRVLVDVPKTNLDVAYDDNRMWRQPEHQGERQRMLDLVRKVTA